ncbi:hypothetical protein [Carnobacterium inhibens]|nr:hypothetical protein [Carnobacterium inhibens]MCM3511369.1 hypothetical protein [Carnobacterium inhibens]
MIVIKKRNKSNYLRAIEALDKRMVLPDEETFHLMNMQLIILHITDARNK